MVVLQRLAEQADLAGVGAAQSRGDSDGALYVYTWGKEAVKIADDVYTYRMQWGENSTANVRCSTFWYLTYKSETTIDGETVRLCDLYSYNGKESVKLAEDLH